MLPFSLVIVASYSGYSSIRFFKLGMMSRYWLKSKRYPSFPYFSTSMELMSAYAIKSGISSEAIISVSLEGHCSRS